MVVGMGREAVVEAMEQGAAAVVVTREAVETKLVVMGTRAAVATKLVVVAMGPAAVATEEVVETELAVVVVKEPAAEELEPEEARKALEAAAVTGPTPAAAGEERRAGEKQRRGQREAVEREQAAGKERVEEEEGRPGVVASPASVKGRAAKMV